MRVTALTVTNKDGHEWLIATEDAEELASTLNQFFNVQQTVDNRMKLVAVGLIVTVVANLLGLEIPVATWLGF